MFTLQLDNTGTWNFTSPISIGSISSTGNCVIHGFIPPGPYNAYPAFRVVSSNPSTTMGDQTWVYANDRPIPSFTATPTTRCPLDAATQLNVYDSNPNTGSFGTDYLWSNPAGNTNNDIYVAPTVNTYYSVTLTDVSSGCTQKDSFLMSVYPAPTVNVGLDHSVCHGLKDTLHAVGTNITYYQWSPTNNMTGYTNANPVITPTATLTYTCTVTSPNGCVASDAVQVISATTTANAGPASYTICSGNTQQLTGTGTYTGSNLIHYSWTPTTGISNPNIANPTVTPLVTTMYHLTTTDSLYGCKGKDSINLIVNPTPTIDAGPNHTVCNGLHDTLHATGTNISTYNWLPTTAMTGNTSANPVITPTVTVTYTCNVTSALGCPAKDSIKILSTVITADAGLTSYTLCSGNSQQLNGSGTYIGNNHITFSWSPSFGLSSATIANPVAMPNLTTMYHLTTTDSVYGCHGNDSINIIVNPTPTIDAGLNHTVCNGLHDTLHAVGTNISTYNWLPTTAMTGNATANPVITPTVTVTYTCNVTSALGCPAKDSIKILSTVITANAGPASYTICSGNSQQLSGTGTYIGNNHITYNWSPSAGLSNAGISNPLATPANTTMYHLTTIDSIYGCHGNDSVNIIVNPTPTVNIGPDHLVCGGLNDTLHAVGTDISTYNWLPVTSMTGNTTANPVLTPTVTVTYTCTVTALQGCIARDTVTIMSSLTTANAGPASYTTCLGSSLQIPGSGSFTGNNHINYNWTPATGLNSTTIPTPTVTPLTTTMYHLVTTDSLYGCIGQDSINIIVGPVVVNANDLTITCSGSGAITATPIGNYVGPLTYFWTPANHLSGTASASVNASPLVSSTYFVTVSTANGCSGSDSSNVTVNVPFNVGFTAVAQLLTTPPFIAQFSNTTPNISNYTFTWNFGDGSIQQTNNATVFHTYAYNGTYDVTLTAVNNTTGCTEVYFQGGFIYSTGGTSCSLTATASPVQNTTGCVGDTLWLASNTGSGYTYQWSLNGVSISGATASTYGATVGGNYSVTVNNGTCSAVSSQHLLSFVSPPATPTITPNGNINLCGSGSVFLTASAGYTSYHWNTGATTQNITATQSGVYSVSVAGASSSCRATATYTLNASVMAPTPICAVGVDSATGKNLVIWNPPVTTQIDSFIVYKEGTVANQFNRIGAVWYHDFSTFLDVNSNPQQQAERYELGIRDSCGILSSLSTYHKTIHLTINQGVGSTWNLLWNNYEGFTFGTFNIYRGTANYYDFADKSCFH